MTTLETDAEANVHNRSKIRIAVIAAALGLVVGLAVGAGAYSIGRGDDGRAQEHVGHGYVGDNQASLWVKKGEAVAVTPETPWIDTQGTVHEDRWPDCLPFETELDSVRWADVKIVNPDGGSYRQVTYVDCSRSG